MWKLLSGELKKTSVIRTSIKKSNRYRNNKIITVVRLLIFFSHN